MHQRNSPPVGPILKIGQRVRITSLHHILSETTVLEIGDTGTITEIRANYVQIDFHRDISSIPLYSHTKLNIPLSDIEPC